MITNNIINSRNIQLETGFLPPKKNLVVAENTFDIGPILKKLATFMVIDHPSVAHVDWQSAEPSLLSFEVCLAKFEIYKARNKSLSTPVVVASASNERNDIVVSPDKLEVIHHEDPKSLPAAVYRTRLSVLRTTASDIPVMANVVATLLAYTTRSVKKGTVDEVIDQVKAKKLRVPYLNLIELRNMMNVVGLSEKDTRDVIYDKLMKSRAYLFYALTIIYNHKEMRSYAEPNAKALLVYNKERPKDLPALDEVLFPLMNSVDIISSRDLDVAWRFLLNSRGIRGADTRGIGSLTFGYMWWDMDRSLFVDLATYQDIMMCLELARVFAVNCSGLNPRVTRMLIASGVTIYSPKCNASDIPDAPCYANSGKKPAIYFIDMDTQTPTLSGSRIEYPEVDVAIAKVKGQKKNKGFVFASVYLTPKLVATEGLSYFPCFRAHNGRCIISTLPSTKIDPGELVARFVSSNHVRNLYPYTRLSYYSQDPYRDMFMVDIRVPRNIPYKTEVLDLPSIPIIISKRRELEYDLEPVESRKINYTAQDFLNAFHSMVDSLSSNDRIILFSNIKNDLTDNIEYMILIRYEPKYSIMSDQYLLERYLNEINARDVVVPETVLIEPTAVLEEEVELLNDDDFTVTTAKIRK